MLNTSRQMGHQFIFSNLKWKFPYFITKSFSLDFFVYFLTQQIKTWISDLLLTYLLCFISFKRVSQNCKYSLEGFDSIHILPIYRPVMSYTLILYDCILRFQKTSLFYPHILLIFKPAHLLNLNNLFHLELLSRLLSFYLCETHEIWYISLVGDCNLVYLPKNLFICLYF